jgi:GNAT superfamily N-acetyltransferase
MAMDVVPFDWSSATDAQARARHALFATVKTELNPGDPVAPLEHLRLAALNPWKYERTQAWAAWDEDVLLGWAQLQLEDLSTNQDQAEFRIEVDPAARRRGVGSRLLEVVARAALAEGRTTLGATTFDGHPGEPFLTAVGAEKRQPFRLSLCRIGDVDVDMLRAWVARAAERAAGYTLVGWDDPCPEDLLEAFTDVIHVMNTAPLDDIEQEDWALTTEQVRDWQAAMERRRYVGWVFAARHDATGRLVGFTEMGFWLWAPARGCQGDTGVDPDHRNLGLGRWLKAAMLLRVLDERPEVDAVETGNASSNRAMLAINVAMGFRPHHHGGFWQVPTTSVLDRLSA